MHRERVRPREGWVARLESIGFDFHTIDGERYWIEDACYAFETDEIERIEDATTELHAMCLDAVDAMVRGGDYEGYAFAPDTIGLIEDTWRQSEPALYGRMDLSCRPGEPPKLLEYNADTPTALFEASVAQWFWLEDRGAGEDDQFNSIHEKLIARWKEVLEAKPARVHFAAAYDAPEDAATAEYLRDTCVQAGFDTQPLHIEDVGWDGVRFVDMQHRAIEALFKLYPWEWLLAEDFGVHVGTSPVHWIEPAWKLLLSDKAILPRLWSRHPGHPNLLPAAFDPAALDGPIVRKPCSGREGEGVVLADSREVLRTAPPVLRPVYQAQARLPVFDGWHALVGAWVVGHDAAGIGIREDGSAITRNTSRFVPHRFR